MERHTFSSRLAISFSWVGHTYSHLFTPIFFTLVPLALEAHLGLSHGETVSLIVVGNTLFGFAAPLAGWLADRWSSVGMMALFYLGTGAGMIMVGFADTPFGIAFGLGVTGLFASIYHPVGVAWLVKVAHNPGTALGINGSFGGMGAALGTVITGALITVFGWRFAYILPGATVLATGAIFVVCILRGWISDTDTSHRRPAPPASRADTIRVVAVLAFVMLCGGMIFHATGPALPKAFALDFSTDGEGVMTVAYLVGLAYAAGGRCIASKKGLPIRLCPAGAGPVVGRTVGGRLFGGVRDLDGLSELRRRPSREHLDRAVYTHASAWFSFRTKIRPSTRHREYGGNA